MLDAAGLQPDAHETAILIDRYRGITRQIDLLWAAELGDEGSALIFSARDDG